MSPWSVNGVLCLVKVISPSVTISNSKNQMIRHTFPLTCGADQLKIRVYHLPLLLSEGRRK